MPRKKLQPAEPLIKERILKKREEDGSLTEIHALEIKGEFKNNQSYSKTFFTTTHDLKKFRT